MKKQYGYLLILLIITLALGTWQSAQASAVVWHVDSSPVKIDARVRQANPNTLLTVIVTLRQQADLARVRGNSRAARQQGVIQALHSTANATQGSLNSLLTTRRAQGRVQKFSGFWVINGFSVTASSDVINELAQHPDVLSISPDDLNIVPAYGTPEPNIALVKAPAVWDQGYTGQGVVIASLDTGVDVNHPELSSRWRGGADSWFDPYGQHPSVPTDPNGHGTQTMGVMVGGDAGGTSLGVAPGAQWIAAKIFNDAGSSTATAIHQSFQWLLDPDGNPATADAPNVVNNSWAYGNPGCYLDFEPDLQALRAAGILPVFAAGNGGPSSNTSYSPANNPSAFAVGAINNSNKIYSYSSRGPSTCGGSTGPFPELVAPGVNINTTDLFGLYGTYSGTSYSAPQVSGGLALLLSAYPNLSAVDQQNALINTAADLGVAGPDNIYGYGRLDLLAAFNYLATTPTSTPPAATSTPTSAPTLTFTPQVTDTATPLPTLTFTPSPTFTATTVAATTMHIGDLDRTSVTAGSKWNATVTIYVHNTNEQWVANATVTGKWTNGATGTVTCTTNASGVCTVSKTGLSTKTTSVTFTVSNVTATGLTYKATANHDPDTDSNGTSITIAKP